MKPPSKSSSYKCWGFFIYTKGQRMVTCKHKEKCCDAGSKRCKSCKHADQKSYYELKYPGRDIWFKGVGLLHRKE